MAGSCLVYGFEELRIEFGSDPEMCDSDQIVDYRLRQTDMSRAFRRSHYAEKPRHFNASSLRDAAPPPLVNQEKIGLTLHYKCDGLGLTRVQDLAKLPNAIPALGSRDD